MTTANSSLQALKEGNLRYRTGQARHPRQDAARRQETLPQQRPFAAILSCSDSRVPPEILFDQGIGDLFVIRTAGHVVDDAVLGSVEYAVDHLSVPLVVVLGHTRCGAVTAAVQSAQVQEKPHGSVGSLVEAILPAVQQTAGLSGDPVANAIDAHIRRTVEALAAVPALAERVRAGALHILGACYDLESGEVVWLEGAD